MRMPVHTSLLEVRRELWALGDYRLPRPLQIVPLLVAIAAVVIEYEVAHHLGAPFSLGTLWVYALPPIALYRLTNRPRIEGKLLHRWLLSQLAYPFQARHYVRLRPMGEPMRARLRMTAWQRAGADRHSWMATGTGVRQ